MGIISTKYLGTNKNRFSAPAGTTNILNNVQILDGQVMPRRGQDFINAISRPGYVEYPNAVFAAQKMFFYNNRPWVHLRDTSANKYGDFLAYFELTTSTWYGAILPNSLNFKSNQDDTVWQPQYVEAKDRLMFNSSTGMLASPKLAKDQSVNTTNSATMQTTMRRAGLPSPGPIGLATVTDASASYDGNWLANGSKVAYRVILKKVDANGNLIYGPPGTRYIVTNSAGASRAIALQIYLGYELSNYFSSGDFGEAARWSIDIYRTKSSVVDASGAVANDPGDDMYFVQELRPTTTDFTNGYVLFTDIQADITLQTALYTNSNQGSALSAIQRFPISRTSAFWQNCLWAGNCTEPMSCLFNVESIYGAGASNYGLKSSDIIILGDLCCELSVFIDSTAGVNNQFVRLSNTCYGMSGIHSMATQSALAYFTPRFKLDYGDPADFVGRMTLSEIFPGQVKNNTRMFGESSGSESKYMAYIGLYRGAGWSGTAGTTPIAPAPLVNGNLGIGYKILSVDYGLGVGDTKLTLNAAPDFAVGDTINIAANMNGPNALRYVFGTVALVPTGQYVVKSIVGSTVTLKDVTNTTTLTNSTAGSNNYTQGAGVFVGYTFLGALHCVKKASTGEISKAIGTQQTNKHRVYFSNPNEPEGAPIGQYLDFGNADKDILKLVPLGESLFIFKTDGLYRAQGYYPNFYSSQFDPNIILAGPELVCQMGGALYAFTTKGVFQITESSSKIISQDIQDQLEYYVWNNQGNVRRSGFAVSNSTDQRALFWIPDWTASGAWKCFVYDGAGWVTRDDIATAACAGVAGDIVSDKYSLYTYKTDRWMTKERKTASVFDYADESFTFSPGVFPSTGVFDIVDSNTIRIEWYSSAGQPTIANASAINWVGAAITQPATGYIFWVTGAVWDSTGVTLTVEVGYPFSKDGWHLGLLSPADDITISLPFTSETQYGIYTEDPSSRQHWTEVDFYFNRPFFTVADISYSSDMSPGLTYVPKEIAGFASKYVDQLYSNGWPIRGQSNGILQEKTIKAMLPNGGQRGSTLRVGLRIRSAIQFYSLYGINVRTVVGGASIERTAK